MKFPVMWLFSNWVGLVLRDTWDPNLAPCAAKSHGPSVYLPQQTLSENTGIFSLNSKLSVLCLHAGVYGECLRKGWVLFKWRFDYCYLF